MALAQICKSQSQLLANPHEPFKMPGFELERATVHGPFGRNKFRIGGQVLFSESLSASGPAPSDRLSGLAENDTDSRWRGSLSRLGNPPGFQR